MTGDTPKRVFGLAKVNTTLQYSRSTQALAKRAFNEEAYTDQLVLDPVAAKAAYEDIEDVMTLPYADPETENVPTLEEMTRAALNVLDNDEDGFFLHVEGGAVDWAGHGNWMGRMIEEQTDFNNAVNAVIEWVEANSSWDETLLIVTGDHETGMLTGPDAREDNQYFKPVTNNGIGVLPTGMFHSDDHSNQLIPLYAKGAYSNMFRSYETMTDPIHGKYIDNTDVFSVMKSALLGDETAVAEEQPQDFEVVSNYPNPFNPQTTITFNMPLIGTANVSIYDMLGQKVATLVDEVKSPGSYSVIWNAEGFASGTYFANITLYGTKTLSHKMTLMK